MGSLLYLAIIAIQFTISLASWSIPMKCFFRDSKSLNSFNNITINSLNVNHDGWILQANDIKFLGMDNAILDDFGINFDTKVAQITFHTDMVVTYNYKSDGTLFSKPIMGEGFTEVPIKNVQMNMNMTFEVIEKDGKKYINPKDFEVSYNIKDKAEFTFSNLYYGDKEQSDTMHSLMNENWRYITTEYGKFFFAEFGANLFIVFKNYALDFSLC
ncbi:uncharacterized protein LOC123658579 [Melitaea cinxia]|uniref:uncharacterized protein LOC123658579 n=1 Tax=Melitaea cinxia TaxID=113334 RepID=UPI001E26EA28|nr:uncharacterized protein LOC123658579 [Melitaea cinxia]